jgi:hypothetical protein
MLWDTASLPHPSIARLLACVDRSTLWLLWGTSFLARTLCENVHWQPHASPLLLVVFGCHAPETQ